jgi:hypothetical protein
LLIVSSILIILLIYLKIFPLIAFNLILVFILNIKLLLLIKITIVIILHNLRCFFLVFLVKVLIITFLYRIITQIIS